MRELPADMAGRRERVRQVVACLHGAGFPTAAALVGTMQEEIETLYRRLASSDKMVLKQNHELQDAEEKMRDAAAALNFYADNWLILEVRGKVTTSPTKALMDDTGKRARKLIVKAPTPKDAGEGQTKRHPSPTKVQARSDGISGES